METEEIDVNFDAHADTPPGKDPDSFSPTLRRYHRLLWGRPLPDGRPFALHDSKPARYLCHHSELGDFVLSSDAGIPSFSTHRRAPQFISQIPEEERRAFQVLTWTIAGSIVFPATRVGRGMTINGARGCHGKIRDRFDLTVECIRRHYLGEPSPLGEVLARYQTFFGLFGTFNGYVSHFLLQDLVTDDCSTVRFFAPFDDFRTGPVPGTLAAYLDYRRLATEFIHARGRRIIELRANRP